MNEERDAQIERLLRAGVPKARIARRLGISRDTVSRVAARAGFPSRRRGHDVLDWTEIRRYYESGHSAADCMRRFGFKAATWTAAINRGEIVPRDKHAQKPAGETRRKVQDLHERGLSPSKIAAELDISTPTACYHLRKLGVPAQDQFARRHDWDRIREAYEAGVSQRECRARFGFSNDAWREAVARGDIVPRSRLIPLEDLLVRGRRTSRGHLKRRLIDAGLKEDKCEECGISEWLGRPLSVQLHHRNGDGTDNRLFNIQFLCPNCHSQTDTWGGRNNHRRPGPDLRLVEEPPEPPEPEEDAA